MRNINIKFNDYTLDSIVDETVKRKYGMAFITLAYKNTNKKYLAFENEVNFNARNKTFAYMSYIAKEHPYKQIRNKICTECAW